MAEREYQRLTPTKSRSVFGIVSTSRSSLWLAKDHILCIDTTGFTESYKRFYYKDIQAFFVRRTQSWVVLAISLAVIGVFFGLVAVFGGNAPIAWTFGTLAGVFFLGAIIDLAYGPSCACHLRTAVQTEELVSITRVRRAQKVLRRLEPLIAEAQGRLDPAELPARYRELLTGGAQAASSEQPNAAPEPAPIQVEPAPAIDPEPTVPPGVAQ